MVCRRVGGVPALWQRLVSQPTNQTAAIGALFGLSVYLELAERLSIRQPVADAVAGLCTGGRGELGNGVVLLPLSERTSVPWRRSGGVGIWPLGMLHRRLPVFSAIRPDDQFRLFHLRRASTLHRRKHDHPGARRSAAHQPTGVPKNPLLQVKD